MNVNKVATIARFEFLSLVKTKGFILTLAAIPLSLLFGSAAMGRLVTLQPARAGVVDQAGILEFNDHRAEGLLPFADTRTALQALRRGQTKTVYIIPSSYGEDGRIETYVRASNPLKKPQLVHRDLLEKALRIGLTAKLSPHAATLIVNPIKTIEMTVAADGAVEQSPAEEERFRRILAPGLLVCALLFVTMQASGYLLHSVSSERESRILDLVLACVSPEELLAGKIAGVGAVSLIHPVLMVLILSAAWIPLLSWPAGASSPWIVFLFMVLGYIFLAGLMTAVGMVVDVSRESNQVAAIWILLNIVPVALLVSLPSWNSPGARFLSWFPLTAPVTMLTRLGFGQTGPLDIIFAFVSLIVATVLCVGVAARLARAASLLRGKPASLASISQALSYD